MNKIKTRLKIKMKIRNFEKSMTKMKVAAEQKSCSGKLHVFSILTHFQPTFHFYTPENIRKRSFKSGTLVENGLKKKLVEWLTRVIRQNNL